MLGRDLDLENPDNREWKINVVLFTDDTALVVDSEKKC